MTKKTSDIVEIINDDRFWWFIEIVDEHCEHYKKQIFDMDFENSAIRYSKRDISIHMLGFLELLKNRPYELLQEIRNRTPAESKEIKSIDNLMKDYINRMKELGRGDK